MPHKLSEAQRRVLEAMAGEADGIPKDVSALIVELAWLIPGGTVPKDMVDRAMALVDHWIYLEEVLQRGPFTPTGRVALQQSGVGED